MSDGSVPDADVEIDPAASVLGTQEYWEAAYAKELENFEENGDAGEVWFGDRPNYRVRDFLLQRLPPATTSPRMLDVGCGNGVTLLVLARAGYSASSLVGVDYSPLGIELARKLAVEESDADDDEEEEEGKGEEGAGVVSKTNVSFSKIVYRVADVLEPSELLAGGAPFDVCIDKGTYDAISLSPENALEQRERYREAMWSVLTSESEALLVITSCNWTADELVRFFCATQRFVELERLAYPVFSFGGKQGQKYSTVIFKRV